MQRPLKIMGEGTTFVLSNSGHLQSLLNPPTNPKASFMIGTVDPSGPDAFVAAAESEREAGGSHWRDWLQARSATRLQHPEFLGSERHPVLAAAPGTYVFD